MAGGFQTPNRLYFTWPPTQPLFERDVEPMERPGANPNALHVSSIEDINDLNILPNMKKFEFEFTLKVPHTTMVYAKTYEEALKRAVKQVAKRNPHRKVDFSAPARLVAIMAAKAAKDFKFLRMNQIFNCSYRGTVLEPRKPEEVVECVVIDKAIQSDIGGYT